MISYIVFFLLFLLPFVILPFGTSYFETPKIFLAEIGIAVIILLTIFGRDSLKIAKVNKLSLGALIIIFIISCIDLLFLQTKTTFLGNIFRSQGIFMLWLLLGFAFVTADRKVPIFRKSLFVILLLQLLFSLVIQGNGVGRAVGTLGEPNAFAAYVVFLWAFVLYKTEKTLTTSLLFKVFVSIFVLGIIVLSGSRSGLIALLIQTLFLLLQRYSHVSLNKSVVVCGLLILFSYLLPFVHQDSEYENRAEIWRTAVFAGFHQPVLGNGFGNIEESLHETTYQLMNPLRFWYVDSSHNIFLDYWVEGGLLGLAALSLLLQQASLSFIKANNQRNLILLLGLLEVLSFNPASIVILLAFWWVIGQSLTLKNK